MTLPIVSDKFNFEKIAGFLKKYEDLSLKQKLLLTPIAISSKEYSKLRETYMVSTKKLRQMYSVPAITTSYMVFHKNTTYVVCSLYYLYEWQKFLAVQCGIVLPLDQLEPTKYSEDVINKYVNFKVGTCDSAFNALVKTKKDGKVLYYEIKDQLLPLKSV